MRKENKLWLEEKKSCRQCRKEKEKELLHDGKY